ncbi:integrase core domain-containing protein [Candidatus Dependentiae bacterium]
MQQRMLHRKFYHIRGIDETAYSKKAYSREKKLRLYKKLVSEGCTQKTALEAIETSKASYYRWKKNYQICGLEGLENESRRPRNLRKSAWTKKDEQLVLKVRKRFKLWGKYKIAAILVREYSVNLSALTVGRIISKFIKKGKIKPVGFYFGRATKKRRVFDHHAQRWQYGMKTQEPGELVQMDHATIRLSCGKIVKHFKAICPLTKLTAERGYTNATSALAEQFLEYAQEQLPFKIKSIQVDGGSEFMGDFENACQRKNISLYVLPPRSPKFNAHVERGNSTVKYEFYYLYDGPSALNILNLRLQKFVEFYNTYRPHQSLRYKTPMEYYELLLNKKRKMESRVKIALLATEANFESKTHISLS